MKNLKLGGLALAVTLALGSGAVAQTTSAGDSRSAQDRIEADYAEAVRRCDEQSGAAKSACLDTARSAQTAARSNADTQTRGADQRAGSTTGQPAGTAARQSSSEADRATTTSAGSSRTPAAGSQSTDRASGDAHTLLFDFGSAELRPEGRAALDRFIAEIQGAQGDRIEVTGHTDRIGSDDVNQALSERRAEAVQAYLRSEGIEASRVNITGRGSEQPETAARDCEGERSTAVITCLQPDRRVTLASAGTRSN